MVRPTELDVIEKKLEGMMNGSLACAIINNGVGGRGPIFLAYRDYEKILVIAEAPLTGCQQRVVEIQFRGRQILEFPAAIAWMKRRIAVKCFSLFLLPPLLWIIRHHLPGGESRNRWDGNG